MKQIVFGLIGVVLPLNLIAHPVKAQMPVLVPMSPLTGKAAAPRSEIEVRNQKASYLAWLLDPVHNIQPVPKPFPLYASRNPLVLPGDIEKIVADTSEKVLRVYGGTAEDTRRLQEIVSVLDRPLRQVEVEVQFVQVDPEEARFLTVPSRKGALNLSPQDRIVAHSARPDIEQQLMELSLRKKAQFLNAPLRVTTQNSVAGIITVPVKPADGKQTPASPATSGLQIGVLSTLNADGKIATSLSLTRNQASLQGNSSPAPPVQPLTADPQLLIINDGEEKLLLTTPHGEFASLLQSQGFRVKEENPNIVLLLKMAVVRRIGEM